MNDEYKGLADRRQAAVNKLMESLCDLTIVQQYWRLTICLDLQKLEQIAVIESDFAIRRRGK